MQASGAYAHLPSPELALKQAEADFVSSDLNGDKLLDALEFLRFFTVFEDYLVSLTAQQRRAEAAFLQFDADRSGFIDLNEFWSAVNVLGLVKHMAPATAQALTQVEFTKHCDAAGRISATSFSKFYLNAEEKALAEFAVETRARSSFRAMDVARVGHISKAQFWSFLQEQGLFEGLTMEQAILKGMRTLPLCKPFTNSTNSERRIPPRRHRQQRDAVRVGVYPLVEHHAQGALAR